MKILKLSTAILFTLFLGVTSCQDEIDNENGENPNTNSVNSETSSYLSRFSMQDGSFDDFLDGISCSSIVFPVTATINGTEVTLVSKAEYALVLEILGRFNDDDDTIVFKFPITVMLSDYTEVQIANQTEYNVLKEICERAEDIAENAINCLDINYPITILTYNLSLEQTGSVVLESDIQLYQYMNNLSNDDRFALEYPITATLNGGTVVELTSDLDLKTQISDCLEIEETEKQAKENADDLEGILVEGAFKVKALVISGIDKVNDFANYTLDFANDFTCTAKKNVNSTIETVEGTYKVSSELDVFLNLRFSGNTTLELLNHTWKIISYSESSIVLQSTTNAEVTLDLVEI